MIQFQYNRPARSTAAIGEGRIVKGTATDGQVTQSSAAADKHVGVAVDGCTGANDLISVTRHGPARVQCGGDVAFGDPLTSDANGAAVVATAGQRFCLIAQENGSVDAFIEAVIAHGWIDTPDT